VQLDLYVFLLRSSLSDGTVGAVLPTFHRCL